MAVEPARVRAAPADARWPAEALVRLAREAPAATAPTPTRANSAALGTLGLDGLRLIERYVPFTRRTVAAGTAVQRAGEGFQWLRIIHSGVVKLVHLAADGRAAVVGLNFKGDWIGFDGIASGECGCDAVAIDTSDIWSVRYSAVLAAAMEVPALLQAMHVAMSQQIAREREWRLGLGSLSSQARLAGFIAAWVSSLAARQMRSDTLALRMTRVEIGSYLGLTHETVSRAFTRLESLGLVRFSQRGRRQMTIPDLDALSGFARLGVADR